LKIIIALNYVRSHNFNIYIYIDLKGMGYERLLTGSIWMIWIRCSLCDVIMKVCLPDKFECFDELRNYFLKQQFATLNCEEMWRAVQK